jgi:hypothetical protein
MSQNCSIAADELFSTGNNGLRRERFLLSIRPSAPDAGALDMSVRRKLEKDLCGSPRELKYSQNLWDGKLVSHHLSESYEIDLGVRQCQQLFKQLGFRRQEPRPLIAHCDPIVQRAYENNPSKRLHFED